jgi:hypothetical protein
MMDEAFLAGSAAAAAFAASRDYGSDTPQLLDEDDLGVLVGLLRMSQSMHKGHLQKLLLNLGNQPSTREAVLKQLLALLRQVAGPAAPGDAAAAAANAGAPPGETSASRMDISEDGEGQRTAQEASVRLSELLDRVQSIPAAGSVAAGASASGAVGVGVTDAGGGKPAVVSRRVLDMLSYLSKNSLIIAAQLLTLWVPSSAAVADPKGKRPAVIQEPDKAAAGDEDDKPPEPGCVRSLEVLLELLEDPRSVRSVSFLEQLLQLLEIVLTAAAQQEAGQKALAQARAARQQRQQAQQQQQRQQGAQQQQQQRDQSQQQQEPAASTGGAGETAAPAAAAEGTTSAAAATTAAPEQTTGGTAAGEGADVQALLTPFSAPTDAVGASGATAAAAAKPSKLARVLNSLPDPLLQQLPALLGREVLSDSAYRSVGKVLKLLIEVAPQHLSLLLAELVKGLTTAADGLEQLLLQAAAKGIDADSQLAGLLGNRGGVVLRMLQTLEGCRAEMQEQQRKKEEAEEKERKRLEKEKEKAEKAKAEKEKDKAKGAAADAGTGSAGQAGASGSGSGGAGAGPSSSRAAAGEAGPSSSSRPAAAAFDPKAALEEINQAVRTIAMRTESLWKALSSCISKIEEGLKGQPGVNGKGAQEAAAAPGGSAAARVIPPGAQLMMPLVEAFFVLCSLEGAIPAAAPQHKAADLLNAFSIESSVLQQVTAAGSSGSGGLGRAPSLTPVASQGSAGAGPSAPRAAAAAAAGGGIAGSSMDRAASSMLELGPTSSSGSGQEGAAGVPFLKFAERHRRLLNAYLRRNSGLLETSLAPLVRVPKLIDFDNKRQYFR